MSDNSTLQSEDLLPVRSRISWGAVLGGSVLALGLYFLLTLLGAAIGLSIGHTASAETLGVSAAVWAIAVTAICLFAGGFIASQFTTGESKLEAALYGLIVWGVVFGMLLWLMATGVRTGFNAMLGVATAGTEMAKVTAQNTTVEDWETMARRAGFDQKQIDEVKQRAKDAPKDAKTTVEDPATKERAERISREIGEAATKASWYAFLGTLISMFSAVVGGIVGSGPTIQVFHVRTRYAKTAIGAP